MRFSLPAMRSEPRSPASTSTTPIDGDVAALLRRAWLDYLVLVFRGQDIDQRGQLAFTRLFGQPGGVFSPRPQRGLDGENPWNPAS